MSVRTLALCSLLLVGVHAGGVGNEAPLADAGLDQEGRVGSTVYLDGTGSTDPDGDRLRYEWSVTHENGTDVPLSCVDCPRPTFTPPSEGTYRVRLEVTDSEGASDTDVLYVGAKPVSPPPAESNTTAQPTSSSADTAAPQATPEPTQSTATPENPPQTYQFTIVPDRSAAPRFDGLCYYDGSCDTSQIPGGTTEYNIPDADIQNIENEEGFPVVSTISTEFVGNTISDSGTLIESTFSGVSTFI